ncbi:MAG: hypothetical protein KKF67_02560 [Nanoarchaeota archaeon]|nr:hypothetical protein [Nanoarchaeota archaeon]
MKKDNWFKRHPVWTGIIGLVILAIIIGQFLPEDNSNANTGDSKPTGLTEQQKEIIIKNAVEYEINDYWQSMGADSICYEYVLEDNWLRLRCDQDLNKAGMQLVVDRIEDTITKDISESLTLNVAFKDYDYNTLEIFTIKIIK